MAAARAYFADIDNEVLLEESPGRNPEPNDIEASSPIASPVAREAIAPIELASGRKVTREWVNALPPLDELDTPEDGDEEQEEEDTNNDDKANGEEEDAEIAIAPLARFHRKSVAVPTPSKAPQLHRRSSVILPPQRGSLPQQRDSLPRMSLAPALARKSGSRARSSVLTAPGARARVSSLAPEGAMPTLAEDDVTEPTTPSRSDGSVDAVLRTMLDECGQTDVHRVAEIPSMGDVVNEFAPAAVDAAQKTKKKAAASPPRLKKIGEGTFGEAYKDASGKVYKVVPMGGTVEVNGEEQKPIDELRAEAVVALRLSRLGDEDNSYSCPYFAKTHAVRVCRGQYDKSLLAEWCRWDQQNESENDCPDFFPEDQLYAVFIVADGGTDLEHYRFGSYDEALAVLLQASLALACGEGACEFEHRDLHWGNLLIAPPAVDADRGSVGAVVLNGAAVELESAAMLHDHSSHDHGDHGHGTPATTPTSTTEHGHDHDHDGHDHGTPAATSTSTAASAKAPPPPASSGTVASALFAVAAVAAWA